MLAGQLEAARRILAAAHAGPPDARLDGPRLSEAFEQIRWFPLPGEGRAPARA